MRVWAVQGTSLPTHQSEGEAACRQHAQQRAGHVNNVWNCHAAAGRVHETHNWQGPGASVDVQRLAGASHWPQAAAAHVPRCSAGGTRPPSHLPPKNMCAGSLATLLQLQDHLPWPHGRRARLSVGRCMPGIFPARRSASGLRQRRHTAASHEGQVVEGGGPRHAEQQRHQLDPALHPAGGRCKGETTCADVAPQAAAEIQTQGPALAALSASWFHSAGTHHFSQPWVPLSSDRRRAEATQAASSGVTSARPA